MKIDERPSARKHIIARQLTRQLFKLMDAHRMSIDEVVDALLQQIVSIVQASVPPSEQGFAGEVLSDVLQRRLTIVSHSDDPPRRVM